MHINIHKYLYFMDIYIYTYFKGYSGSSGEVINFFRGAQLNINNIHIYYLISKQTSNGFYISCWLTSEITY